MPDIMTWPTDWWGVASAQFYLMPKSQRSQSPWTSRQNVYPVTQFWMAKLSFPPMTDTDLAAREAFIDSLVGSSGLIRMGNPYRVTPQYNGDATMTSSNFTDVTNFTDNTGFTSGGLPPNARVGSNADVGTNAVVLAGLLVSKSRILRAGDMIEFRRGGVADETPSLHRIMGDVNSDSSGRAGVKIAPALRKGVASNDTVVLDYPTSVFRLMDDGQGFAERDAASNGSFGMTLIEALA